MKKIIFTLSILLCIAGLSFAQGRSSGSKPKEDAGEEKVIRKVSRTVQGEVSSIDKRSIAVVTNRNKEKGVEDEIVVLLDKNTQFANKDSLSQIQVGDTVRVQFDDLNVQVKDRQESRSRATAINFIKEAKKPVPIQREAVPQE